MKRILVLPLIAILSLAPLFADMSYRNVLSLSGSYGYTVNDTDVAEGKSFSLFGVGVENAFLAEDSQSGFSVGGNVRADFLFPSETNYNQICMLVGPMVMWRLNRSVELFTSLGMGFSVLAPTSGSHNYTSMGPAGEIGVAITPSSFININLGCAVYYAPWYHRTWKDADDTRIGGYTFTAMPYIGIAFNFDGSGDYDGLYQSPGNMIIY